MKIAAVLFILSVYYIADTEQAARPAGPGVHSMMHPAGPGSMEEMQHMTEEAMREFRRKAGALGNGERAKAQYNIPTDPKELYECANQDCDSELIKILSIVAACSVVYLCDFRRPQGSVDTLLC